MVARFESEQDMKTPRSPPLSQTHGWRRNAFSVGQANLGGSGSRGAANETRQKHERRRRGRDTTPTLESTISLFLFTSGTETTGNIEKSKDGGTWQQEKRGKKMNADSSRFCDFE